MVFSSHKLVFVLNIEITGTFYRLGNRSTCPQNLTPPKKKQILFLWWGKIQTRTWFHTYLMSQTKAHLSFHLDFNLDSHLDISISLWSWGCVFWFVVFEQECHCCIKWFQGGNSTALGLTISSIIATSLTYNFVSLADIKKNGCLQNDAQVCQIYTYMPFGLKMILFYSTNSMIQSS